MADTEILANNGRRKDIRIIDTGSQTYNRFIVREVLSDEEKNEHPNCNYGPVVGHMNNGIIFGKNPEVLATSAPAVSFGGAALYLSVVDQNLINSLATAFGSIKIAHQIIVIAGLKILKPGITQVRLKTVYENSYLSVAFPGVPLSKNTVGDLYHKIGLSVECRNQFHRSQILQIVRNDIVIIDGTLVQDTSYINFFSQRAYKELCVKTQNCVYLYNNTQQVIISSETYPGNFSDTSVFRDFLIKNKLHSGILVADRGFPVSIILDVQKTYPDEFSGLRYILRLKSNDKRIKEYNLKQIDGMFEYGQDIVGYKKVKTDDGLYLFAYKNYGLAIKEGSKFVKQCYKKNDDINNLSSCVDDAGFIFLITNDDFDPLFVYDTENTRFKIETVFDFSKNTLRLDSTNVQDDFSVTGQDFVNEISTSLGIKMSVKLNEAHILGKKTFNDAIDDLNLAWRSIREGEREQESLDRDWILNEGLPNRDDKHWVHTSEKTADMIESLGLSSPSKNKSVKDDTPKQDVDEELIRIEIANLNHQLTEKYITLEEKLNERRNDIPELYDKDTLSNDNITQNTIQIKGIDLEIKKLLKECSEIQERIDALYLKLHGINTNNKKNKSPGHPKSPETLELEQKLRDQGIDPASDDGKKMLRKLKHEAKTGNKNCTLGRPKSPETLELEQKLRDQGIDPASDDGKKMLRKLKREAKTGNTNCTLGRPKSPETLELEQKLLDQGIDPASDDGKKMLRKLKREAKTGNTNCTLGRPKSPETLELEQKLRDQGIDPASDDGKKMLRKLKREVKTGNTNCTLGRPKSPETLELEQILRDQGIDPASDDGKKMFRKLKRKSKNVNSN